MSIEVQCFAVTKRTGIIIGVTTGKQQKTIIKI